jgi:hypothetical protein
VQKSARLLLSFGGWGLKSGAGDVHAGYFGGASEAAADVNDEGDDMELIWTVGLDGTEFSPGKPGVVLRALVMYEDAAVGNRALTMLNSVVRGVATPGQLRCSLWRFHFLNDPSLLEMAAAEAAGADIILIALPNWASLPSEVSEWISLWLGTRGKRPKALVALADERARGNGATPCAFTRLREVAQMGRMDFFPAGGGGVASAAVQAALARLAALRSARGVAGSPAQRPRARRAT